MDSSTNMATSEQALISDRRIDPRFAVSNPAALRVVQTLPISTFRIRVLDVSKNGLRLRVPEAVDTGSAVQVLFSRSIVYGTVRYSRAAEDGFDVGVEIEEVLDGRDRGDESPGSGVEILHR